MSKTSINPSAARDPLRAAVVGGLEPPNSQRARLIFG
jgi:hypothetical protein